MEQKQVEELVQKSFEAIKARDPNQVEFLQAVEEVLQTLVPLFVKEPKYLKVLPAIAEPERLIQFRVPWVDRNGDIQINRGFRIQYNSAIGPYKGGLRLHPTVNLSVLKFLAFEQVFKNSLTTLPMGGGKGGSDFDPKGKNDAEVRSFCQSFMTELFRHIGANTDVPAGDIGVGAREIGFLFGQYKRLRNEFTGVLTGKGPTFGGSKIRPEATGYGAVYFAKHGLDFLKMDPKGLKAVISGSGNVAQYACEKCLDFGMVPVTFSDSQGYVHEPNGFTREDLKFVMELKNVKRGRISEYVNYSKTAKYYAGKRPWEVPCEVALPCATQNELNGDEAAVLVKNGCKVVSEGANMPSTPAAIAVYKKEKILYLPGKAANAGGVSVSGLEMSQNSLRLSWTRDEVDKHLQRIMKDIWDQCAENAKLFGEPHDIQMGANIAGFKKVADTMLAQGDWTL